MANSILRYLMASEANWFGSALLVIKSVNFCINNPDQIIWLAENKKWAWHLNLFSITRVNIQIGMPDQDLLFNHTDIKHKIIIILAMNSKVWLVVRKLRVRTPPGRQHSFMEIDHEIFSTVILSLPLIQERQLSVSGKCKHNWLTT